MDADRSHSRVVVVGGGLAGAMLAKLMQFDADVVLIDSKEYFEIPWARNRAMVEPPFAERAVIQHSDFLSNCRIVSSPAIDVTEAEVMTAEGRTFGYDYLAIATGHFEPVPRARAERLRQFKQVNERIKSSRSVLIIGGGRMGVELAGEIAVDFPEKKVTIVHEGLRLVQVLGPKASEKARKWLTSKGVDVVLGESIDLAAVSEGSTEFTTSGGRKITADCYVVCVGRPLGSAWLSETILKDQIDRFGRLMVDQHLRVKGRKNIFGIGDITDVRESKQGSSATKHAAVTAKNMKLMLRGGSEEKLAEYKPGSGSAPAFVSLGRKEAVAQFSFTTLGGYLPGLFVGRSRRKMGLEPDTV